MITIKHTGNFNNTERFLNRAKLLKLRDILERYGKDGVTALSVATPKDTGETSRSWSYEVRVTNKGYRIEWFNTNENDGVIIAILIQYGHGTRNGTYIQGIDYINPAMKPVFDRIANAVWEEVLKL